MADLPKPSWQVEVDAKGAWVRKRSCCAPFFLNFQKNPETKISGIFLSTSSFLSHLFYFI
jgi:hypothetical protein